ncbi:hypothetical protein [Deinococcus sp.]|uniref:hypothetical protein n=1 Tax=Deinococcus sp. TaxID=47478 RepID=UPI0025ECA32C|nr:hypothetical protein [Deinococcus sp.]
MSLGAPVASLPETLPGFVPAQAAGTGGILDLAARSADMTCQIYRSFQYSNPAVASASLNTWLGGLGMESQTIKSSGAEILWLARGELGRVFGRWQADQGGTGSGQLDLCSDQAQFAVDTNQTQTLSSGTTSTTRVPIFLIAGAMALLIRFLNKIVDGIRFVVGGAMRLFKKS